MKKWIKKLLLTALAVLMIFTVIGCGKKEADTKDTVPEAAEINEDTSQEETPAEEEEETEEEEVIPEDTTTPVQKFWSGDWFGYMWIETADGALSEWQNCYWDAMATIDVDENGAADMLFWYESLSRENPAGHVQLTISEDSGSGEMGAAISESGWIFVDSDTGNGDVHHADWIIDPMTDPTSVKFGNDMIHFYGEYVEGNGSLGYHYFLRKWGTYWDDVAQDEEELIPRGYDRWYKPLIDEGYAMPNNIGEEGTVKMGEEGSAQSSGTASTSAGSDSQADASDSQAGASDSQAGASDSQAGGKVEGFPVSGSYDGGEMVLVDDDTCKITVTGTGANPHNDSWIGYTMIIENKTDHSIYVTPYAEPDLNQQTVSGLGKGNTCFFGGEKTPTHMGYTVNPGSTVNDACMAIDGVTDVSQLGNVQGYLSISNNETGEVLNNVPYSF